MMMHDFQLPPAMQEHPVLNGQKRTFDAAIIDDARYEDPRYAFRPCRVSSGQLLEHAPLPFPSIANLPSFDKNAWYYPSQEYEFDDDRLTSAKGNWGRKLIHDARWTRTGKIAPWAPGLEDRQVCTDVLLVHNVCDWTNRSRNAPESASRCSCQRKRSLLLLSSYHTYDRLHHH